MSEGRVECDGQWTMDEVDISYCCVWSGALDENQKVEVLMKGKGRNA